MATRVELSVSWSPEKTIILAAGGTDLAEGESFGGFHEGKLQLRSNSATGGQQQSNAPAELHLHSGAVGGVHSGFSPPRGVNEFKTSSLTRRQLSQIHRRGNLI